MARDPTTFSRVSTGYKDSANTIAESGYDLDFIDGVGDTLTLGGGTTLTHVSVTTHTVDFGSVTAYGYSTLTVGVSGATYEDAFLVTTPSIWSGADDALSVAARSGDTTGEVDLVCVNSGATARDATSGTFIVTRIGA
jgi:hypothetical protein